jgi:hypothetical protein
MYWPAGSRWFWCTTDESAEVSNGYLQVGKCRSFQ